MSLTRVMATLPRAGRGRLLSGAARAGDAHEAPAVAVEGLPAHAQPVPTKRLHTSLLNMVARCPGYGARGERFYQRKWVPEGEAPRKFWTVTRIRSTDGQRGTVWGRLTTDGVESDQEVRIKNVNKRGWAFLPPAEQ